MSKINEHKKVFTEQEVLNNFYISNQILNKNSDICLRLNKSELEIITKALSLLDNVDIKIAEEKYKEYKKITSIDN